MNYPFSMTSSLKIRRFLSLSLVTVLTATALTGCFSKKDIAPAEDPDINLPNLVDTTDPVEEETETETEAPTEPEKDDLAVVKEQLSVRSSPSTGSNVTATLDAGEKVEVLRVEPVNGTQWAYIYSAGNNIKGWVATDLLDMTNVQAAVDSNSTPAGNGDAPAPTPPAGTDSNSSTPVTVSGNGTLGVVTSSDLNIRSEANTSSTRVGGLSHGDRVTITETSGTWGRIKQGWVSLDYIYIDGKSGKNPATGTITATELTVRSGPGTGYDKATTLKQGATVEVLEQIRIGNMTWGCIKGGWISMDYVNVNGKTGGTLAGTTGTPVTNNTTGTTTNNTPTANNGNSTSIGTATVTGNGLNIRSGAGTNFPVVSGLKQGASVAVYEKTTVGNSTWGRVDGGWICLDYTNMK